MCRKIILLYLNFGIQKGTYVCTLDNYHQDPDVIDYATSENPAEHKSNFEQYFESIDILINATYWNDRIPRIFTLKQMKLKNFKIKLIADISCDIKGLIPCTL